MLTVSTRTLKTLAAFVWYIGGFVLLLKGYRLLIEADSLKPGQVLGLPWTFALAGPLIGGLKAKFLFSKSCRKNLARIAALDHPKIWEFFSSSFFAFLILMVLAGASLSRQAHDNYGFLISVAIVDISIAIALLGSGYVFWKQKVFVK